MKNVISFCEMIFDLDVGISVIQSLCGCEINLIERQWVIFDDDKPI